MRKQYYQYWVSGLSIGFILLTLQACVQASKSPLTLSSTASNNFTYDYYETAIRQLHEQKDQFNLDLKGITFSFISESSDKNGKAHVKIQPEVQNIPIWSQEMIVHLNNNEQIESISGNFRGNPNIVLTPEIENAVAELIAKNFLQNNTIEWQVDESTLNIYPSTRHNNFELVYIVTLHKGLKRHFVFVSAINSKIVHNVSGNLDLK